MGREVGGGIGMGKTCEPKAFSFQCMTKFTTNKKKEKRKKKLAPFLPVCCAHIILLTLTCFKRNSIFISKFVCDHA